MEHNTIPEVLSDDRPQAGNVAVIRAVLFDLDGTLVRTFIDFPGMRSALRQWAAQRGAIYESIANAATDTLEIMHRLRAAIPEHERDAASLEMNALIERHEDAGCDAMERIDGAEELVNNLRARGLRIGVVTRNCRRIATALLARAGLTADTLVAREDTQTFKPHPEPVLLACQQLGVPPERAAMIGDLWTDVAAGKAAGVALTIGIQWAHDPPGRFGLCAPDHEVVALSDVGAILMPNRTDSVSFERKG